VEKEMKKVRKTMSLKRNTEMELRDNFIAVKKAPTRKSLSDVSL
jgi:hypothetical protein